MTKSEVSFESGLYVEENECSLRKQLVIYFSHLRVDVRNYKYARCVMAITAEKRPI